MTSIFDRPHGIDIYTQPTSVFVAGQPKQALIKVDYVLRMADICVLSGWSTVPEVPLTLLGADGAAANMVERRTVARGDVAGAYGIASGAGLGFLLVAHELPPGAVALSWTAPPGKTGRSGPMSGEERQPGELFQTLAPDLLALLRRAKPGSPRWRAILAQFPRLDTNPGTAVGHFDGAAGTDPQTGGACWGWVLQDADTLVWLEDEAGRTYSLDGAHKERRPDVLAAFPDLSAANDHPGFFADVPWLTAGRRLHIMAASPRGRWSAGSVAVSNLTTDPKQAAATLYAIKTSMVRFNARAPQMELPVLGRILARERATWTNLTPQRHSFGTPPATPEVSIIIPLYGRTDFVEHQLMDFARDPWLRDHAEVVYVMDDPRLAESFPADAAEVFAMQQMPFRLVWGEVNRGFSGANNLGAAEARAPRLLFMNSDVFPRRPGWLQDLVQVLDTRPEFGALAPRLLFADGSIQHAGMINRRHDHFGIWINHHPLMGFDPAMDPHHGPTEVPLVTGACVLMRRADFDRVGGWDTGYLIGDFEDSDLCFKIRETGLKIGYVPEVELTHLERQSFGMVGEDGFRLRVTIGNALRHQSRWPHYLDATA